jgi:DNA repair protein SbcD/Mre11
MKIFHTADWHIGKVFLNKSFIDEQREVIAKFIEKVKTESPDLIIIAGDVYDKSIPTIEAVDLLNETLKELVIEMEKKVIVVSGNHDSADRLSFGSEILKSNGLYIVTDAKTALKPIELEDEFGKVDVYALPYISPMKARAVFGSSEIKDHDDIARLQIKKIKQNWNENNRNICIYHGFITNGSLNIEESESERPLSIGGSDYVNVDYFTEFDYVAIGHLHGPQKVKEEFIRYSGSLMKYSFSEQHQKKGITKISLGKKADGFTDIEYKLDELYPAKDMRVIEGTMEELLEEKADEKLKNDYLMIRIIHDGEIYAPKEKLDKKYPNILKIEVKRNRTGIESEKNVSREISSKNIIELFAEFYETVTEEKISDEKQTKLISLIEDVKLEEE